MNTFFVKSILNGKKSGAIQNDSVDRATSGPVNEKHICFVLLGMFALIIALAISG